MNGFFYRPPRPRSVFLTDSDYTEKTTPSPLLPKRPSTAIGSDFRVRDVLEFKNKMLSTKQELKRVPVTLVAPPLAIVRTESLENEEGEVEGSSYKVKERSGRSRLYFLNNKVRNTPVPRPDNFYESRRR